MPDPAQPSSKPSLAKRLLKWAGLSALVLAAVVAAAPSVMPTGWIKDLVREESRKAIGAPVEVSGVSLGWLSGVTLEGIEIPNAAGFSGAPLLKVARVHVDPDLLGFLSGKVHLRAVEVEGVVVSLEQRDPDGAWNAEALQPPPGPPAPAAGPPPEIAIDRYSVKGGAVLLAAGQRIEVRDLSLTGSAPSALTSPIPFELSANAACGPASWRLEAKGDASAASVKADLTLAGKGLPPPLALGEGRIAMAVSWAGGKVSVQTRESSLKGLEAAGILIEELVAGLKIEGDPAAVLSVEADVCAKGIASGDVRVAEFRARPSLILDVARKSVAIASCPLSSGPFSGSIEGEASPGKYRLKQTLRGELAELPKAVSGLPLAEGAAFTGALDSALEIIGDAKRVTVDGAATLAGFSVSAPGVGKVPQTDLRIVQKLTYDLEADRLEVTSLGVTAGGEKGPLDVSLSGTAEHPGDLGPMAFSGRVRADLAELRRIVAGAFPKMTCAGRVDGTFTASGDAGQTAVRANLALAGGRFSGGPFGDGVLDVPEAKLTADADIDRGPETLRVVLRTLQATTPFFTASFKEGFLAAPWNAKAGKYDLEAADLQGTLEAASGDLAAATRFLKGAVKALRPYDLAGKAACTARLQGKAGNLRADVDAVVTGASCRGEGFPAASVREARLAADLEAVRDGTVRVHTLTLAFTDAEALRSRASGTVAAKGLSGRLTKEGGIAWSREGEASVDLAASAGDLSAFAESAPQLKPHALKGAADLRVILSGPPSGPWKAPSLTLACRGLSSSTLPLPPDLSLSARDLELAPGRIAGAFEIASEAFKAAGSVKADVKGAVEVPSLDAVVDLAKAKALLKLDRELSLTGTARVKGLKASGTLEKVVVSLGLSLEGFRASGGPLGDAVVAEKAVDVAFPPVTVNLSGHGIAFDKPLQLSAPGLGLQRLSVASFALADWTKPAEARSGAVEADLDAGPAVALARAFGAPPELEASGPVSVRSGGLTDASGNLSLDATAARITHTGIPFTKPAGEPLTLAFQGAVEKGVLRIASADIVLMTLRTGLEPGSVLPLDAAGEAKLRLKRTVVDLPSMKAFLPALKDVAGTVTLEGGLEGPLAHPEALRPDLSIAIDGVALTYKGAEGQDVPVTAAGRIRATPTQASMKDLRITVAGEILTVAAEVRDYMKRPAGSLRIAGGSYDLDKLLKLAPAQAAPPAYGVTPPKAASAEDRPLLPKELRQADLAVDVTLKQIVWKGNRLAALDSKTTLKAGQLDSHTKALVNEGPVSIDLTMDGAQKDPPVALAMAASGVKLDIELPKSVRYFLPILAGGKGIRGNLTLEPVRLEGHGATWKVLKTNLHTVSDGRIRVSGGEVSSPPFFADILKHVPQLKDLKFDSIDAPFRVKDQQVDNLGTVVSGPKGQIRMAGWVHFDGRLEQHSHLSGEFLKSGNAQVDKILEITMTRGGILTEGTIDAPHTKLDIEAALKELAKDALKDGLQDLLKKKLKERLPFP